MDVRVGVVAVAVVLAVAGCSGGDPSGTEVPPRSGPTQTSPPPSNPPSTAAATSTPTPAPPPMPALARQDTPTGATTFARYWLVALNYAYKTGDTTPFRMLGKCSGCTSLADSIDKIYAAGGSVSGGDLKLLRSRVDRHVKGSAAAVELFYSRTQRVVLDGKGGRFVDPAASRLGFFLVLDRAADAWQVNRFPVLEN